MKQAFAWTENEEQEVSVPTRYPFPQTSTALEIDRRKWSKIGSNACGDIYFFVSPSPHISQPLLT